MSDALAVTESASRPSTRLAFVLVFGVAAGATAYAPLLALHNAGLRAVFEFFAGDAFYYLAVAKHSVGAPFFTFDGVHPTNGFHPLWQAILSASFGWLALDDPEQLRFTFHTGIVLAALGTGAFAVTLLRLTGRPALALLGSVPGFYWILIPLTTTHHSSTWSFINGMESPLSIFLFGLLSLLLFQRELLRRGGSLPALILLSLLLSLITLSRLDDVFVFAPFLAWAVLEGGAGQKRARRFAACAALPLLLIGTYLLYNLSYAGSLLPSSGVAKAGGPVWGLLRNLHALLQYLFPLADPLGRGLPAWYSEAWRVTQMLLPALLCCGWLLSRSRPSRGDPSDERGYQDRMVSLLAAYVLLKAAYNFAMVGIWNQGHWYYPLAIMISNLIIVTGISRLLDRQPSPWQANSPMAGMLARWPRLGRFPAATVGSVIFILISANAFADLKQRVAMHARSYVFWSERHAIQTLVDRRCEGCGILAFDDGIVSFSLDSPTLNALGLTMDPEAGEARRSGELLDLAWKRGHRLLASVNYLMPAEAYDNPNTLRQHLLANHQLAGQDLDRWHFELAFRSPSGGFPFVRFEPKAP
ncbi:MAG: hypothetical protein JRH19_15305 [Deltaproteobacteria bacterium]|nr:hypothetical protein [Deltaproteobacteria bacterium]